MTHLFSSAASAVMGNNPFNSVTNNNSFSPVFQGSHPQSSDVLLGDLLTPVPVGGVQQDARQVELLNSDDTKDLSSSLARAAKSLGNSIHNSFSLLLDHF